MKITLKVQG